MTIAASLLASRKATGMNRAEAARKLECDYSQLHRYETGVNSPGPEMLNRMADAYSCTVDQLLGRSPLEVRHAG